jgi:hypothetical protein
MPRTMLLSQADVVRFRADRSLCGGPDNLEHVVEDIPRLSLARAAIFDLESLHEAERHGLAEFLHMSLGLGRRILPSYLCSPEASPSPIS